MDTLSVALFSYGGGFALKLLELAEVAQKTKSQRQPTFSDWLFVLLFFLLPGIGCIVAIAYSQSGTPLTPLLTLQIGASAPVIIRSFASVAPRIGEKNVN